MSNSAAGPSHETNIIETIQSLVVAFVLAMTFRGFVTEGFVIPTGSMAPTLLGQHVLAHSEQTGVEFPVGADQHPEPIIRIPASGTNYLVDPMLGPGFPGIEKASLPRRMGDRILVLKCLYPFTEPKRFDVVVFKNPTDPTGEAANYIKRLIGLPNEQIWLADGDVFARPASGGEFRIQRKPEHVQRAVWQPVHHSDYIPLRPQRLNEALRRDYQGPPWTGEKWDTTGRDYRCDTAEPTTLTWDNSRRPLNDWASYNLLVNGQPRSVPVSDIRVSAGIEARQPGLKTTFELESRGQLFQFTIEATEPGRGQATLRMRPLHDGDPERVVGPVSIAMPGPGRVVDVEFWHVDQSMQMYFDGKRAMPPLEYDWTPVQRLQNAIGNQSLDDVDQLIQSQAVQAQPPQLRWRFEGSPVTLHRVRVDRDLHYRYDTLRYPFSGDAFGTNPNQQVPIGTEFNDVVDNGKLGPDQFMMCGDNSQMSLDSRLWGRPHPLVAQQIDNTPFVVNRKLLLGKAWVVYFPAPFSITEGGVPFVPDFGRLRFIR